MFFTSARQHRGKIHRITGLIKKLEQVKRESRELSNYFEDLLKAMRNRPCWNLYKSSQISPENTAPIKPIFFIIDYYFGNTNSKRALHRRKLLYYMICMLQLICRVSQVCWLFYRVTKTKSVQIVLKIK